MNTAWIAGAQRRFEEQLLDSVAITRDLTGVGNATLDTDTGKLVGAADDAYIFDPQPCLIRPAGNKRDIFKVLSGAPLEMNYVDVIMRARDQHTIIGDLLTVKRSTFNPGMVNREFTVIQVDMTSLNFAQVVTCEEVLGAVRRSE